MNGRPAAHVTVRRPECAHSQPPRGSAHGPMRNEATQMRPSHTIPMILGLLALGAACAEDANGPSTPNTPPTAAFTATCILLECTFSDRSTDADGEVAAYHWDFGDGAAAGTTMDVRHTYAAPSTYAVTLTVTDDDGAAEGVTESVQVRRLLNLPPAAGFTSSCAALACTFTGLGSDDDGTVVAFEWTFGDGAEAATQEA